MVINILNELFLFIKGGWPVINENWMPVNWKKEELLARLRAELNQGNFLVIFTDFRCL